MLVPATTLSPAPLTPVGIEVTAAANPTIVASAQAPARTVLRLRRERLNVLAYHRASVTGTLLENRKRGIAGEIVRLQMRARHGWHTLARARTHAGGRFRITYAPRELGSRAVRLLFAGTPTERPSHRRLGRLNSYRVVEASWYGGGGNLACGGTLTSATLGVANKTLPCGTRVTLRYGDHVVRVPVVDRGPYVAGREFDLTEATKHALGFADVGEVWSTD